MSVFLSRRRQGVMRLTLAILCVLLASQPLTASFWNTPEIELIARQAPFIVKGKVLPGFRLQIEKQYKGQIHEEIISIPDLRPFSERVMKRVFLRWGWGGSLPEEIIKRKAELFQENGLIGSTVVVLLEKTGEGYGLKGTTLKYPKENLRYAAIKVLSGDVVLGFFQTVFDPELTPDRHTPTIEELDASIRYDRPLFLRFGFVCCRGVGKVWNCFYLSLTNLTDKPVRVNLDKNMKLTIEGSSLETEKELPGGLWKLDDFQDLLPPGETAGGQYLLDQPGLRDFGIRAGQRFQATLTIRIGQGGQQDVYSGKAEALVYPTPLSAPAQ